MSEQAIVDRIIADAEREAEAIIAAANKRAEEIVGEANSLSERKKEGEKAALDKKVKSILDGKAATARLDSAKILLGEKRGVIDEVYSRALKELNELSKGEALYLFELLLEKFAEEGDEIVFAENYKFAAEAAKAEIVREKKLKVSKNKLPLGGGFILLGKTSDKDISYEALLADDREENQAAIAAQIFSV